MDTAWLEDFLAIVEEGGFRRAAERRAVSQPAFSRRIKALEDWVGASLFDRATHSVTLTAAGERLLPAAEEILRRLKIARADASSAAQLQHDTLKLAATHVLSLTFLPIWLRSVEALAPMTGTVQLTSDNMAACENLKRSDQKLRASSLVPFAGTTLPIIKSTGRGWSRSGSWPHLSMPMSIGNRGLRAPLAVLRLR